MHGWINGAAGLAFGLVAAGTALAEDWTRLTGPEITGALSARLLSYGNGGTQNFHSDGSTLYESGPPSTGRWRVEGDRYCSVWPPQEHWACYDIDRSASGLEIRFIADDGTETVGRYVDLQ
jgi:hypothetical protein